MYEIIDGKDEIWLKNKETGAYLYVVTGDDRKKLEPFLDIDYYLKHLGKDKLNFLEHVFK